PNGTVWSNGSRGKDIDLVMLATEGPTSIDLDRLDQRLRKPEFLAVARSLAEGGFASAIDVMATYTGRKADLEPWLARGWVNRDGRPWLQPRAGLEPYPRQKGEVYGATAGYRHFPEDLFEGSEESREKLETDAAREAEP